MLGPIAVIDGTREVPLGGPRQRAVLALLLTMPGRAVSADRLVDEVWRDDVDVDRAKASLYTLVSNLRRALGSVRIRHGPTGYVLDLQAGDTVDAHEFESAIAAADRTADRPSEMAALLADGLSRWKGSPYAGSEDVPTVAVEANRLEELWTTAQGERIDALLRAGEGPPVHAALALRDRRPLDEGAWSLLIRSLYRAGRQTEALRAARELRATLRDELGIDPSPRLERLEEQVLIHDPALDRRSVAAVHDVPAYLSSFVGRTTDLDVILEALATHRLVTITGPGGAGKTRLATELASRVRDRFPDGIWLVDLARSTDASGVIAELAAALHASAHDADPVSAFREVLEGKRTLIIIDNAEHVVTRIAAAIGDLLGEFDRLSVLATSRVALGCPGERIVPLGGLPVGEGDAVGDAERLFVDRCGDHGADVEGASDSVRAVCRRLDGLPLALELAASRSATIAPDEMARLIAAHDVELTDSGQAREIHRSLQATIDWSYGLLDARDRSAFAALGIFEGRFGSDAATVVLASTEREARDTLHRLATASMVTSRQVDGRTTYRLLETLRAFARDRLDETSRRNDVVARHEDHYVERAVVLADDFLGRERVAATTSIMSEYAEYVATWERLITADPGRLLPIGWSLGNVWLFEGRLAEGAVRLDRLVDATRGHRSVARADVLVICSWITAFRNDIPRALELAEAGLTLYHDLGSPERIAYGLARVGHWEFALGEGEAALAHLKESIAALRAGRLRGRDGLAADAHRPGAPLVGGRIAGGPRHVARRPTTLPGVR